MLRRLFGKPAPQIIRAAAGSWLETKPRYRSPHGKYEKVFTPIEEIALETQQKGELPLWKGYSEVADYPTEIGPDAKRSSDNVRTTQDTGEFFTWLVLQRHPKVMVEFGTAFGVSGMYWLAGLELNGDGHLFTFEPNQIWADIARDNLSTMGTRYTLTPGTFEDNAGLIEDHTVDLAFIDAIHTGDFVRSQLQIVLQKAAPGALVLFDDIDFSDDMRSCWNEISQDQRFAGAGEFNRVGIIELK